MVSNNSIWQRTKKLLILYVYKNQSDFEQFQLVLNQELKEAEIEDYRVLVQYSNNEQVIEKKSNYYYISDNDISIFGRIKKRNKQIDFEGLESSRKINFDSYLCFGTPSIKVVKWLNKFSIKNRICVNCEKSEFFEIYLNNHSEFIKEMFSFAVSTLKKIE